MKHLGDITKLSGYVVPAVDVVIGGSPCQGLSVAGKQAGLKDERSGLFIEQIRLVKEMRKADAARGKTNDAIRPRYMVWENVPGAFSSNQGRDFEAVLEETVRVAEPKAPPVPVPAKGWPTSGCLVGDGWSVAWRVLDAQFWGTPDKPLPQRRRRISLVADFGGRTAPEILFERESVSWNPDESRATAERNSCSPESNFGNAGRAGMERARRNGEPEPQVIASGVDCRSYNVSEGVSGTILAKRISSHFALEYRNPALDASLITTKNANVAGTLDASYYKGCGMRSGVEREVVVDTPTSKSSSRSGSMLARTHSRATGTTLYPRHLSARAQPESCAPAAISRRATGLASTCIRSPASRLRPGSTQRPSSSNRAKRPLTCPHRSGAAHRTRSTPAQAWLRAAERPQT